MFIGISILIILVAAYARYIQYHKEKLSEMASQEASQPEASQEEMQELEESLVSLQETIHQTLAECKNRNIEADTEQTHQVN